MLTRVHHLGCDERGISLVLVSLGLASFVAATSLAVDVGLLLNARSQAQNSADAGALAGATALAFNDFGNRSSSGPAVQGAVNAALANQVAGSAVSIGPGDVTFPVAPSGVSDRVRVTVYRTAERGDPVTTMVARIFGVSSANITATATAEAVLGNGESCVKPWAIPDKWIERQTPAWDVTDTFTAFPSNPSVFPDIFRDVTQTTYSGYTRTDVGLQLDLTTMVSNTIRPDMFVPIRLPGASGESDFVNLISACETSQMTIGDSMTIEGTAVAQDTIDGANNLIALDPTAYWNQSTQTVISPISPRSPRVIVLPLYDTLYFDQGKKVGNFTQIRISNFIGFFVDHVQGSKVSGRVMPVLGQVASNGTPAPVGSFARAIRLVE